MRSEFLDELTIEAEVLFRYSNWEGYFEIPQPLVTTLGEFKWLLRVLDAWGIPLEHARIIVSMAEGFALIWRDGPLKGIYIECIGDGPTVCKGRTYKMFDYPNGDVVHYVEELATNVLNG